MQLAEEHRGHRDRDHHREGDAVVAGELEDDDHGRDRGAQRAGGDRPHAEERVDARRRAELGEEAVGDQAIGAADHGAEHQARAEHPAAEAAAEAERGRRRLGDRQQDQELEAVAVLEREVGGLVADPQHLGQPEGDQAGGEAGEGGAQPGRRAEPLVAPLHQGDGPQERDRRQRADQPEQHEGRDLEERDHVLRRQGEGGVGADVDAGDHGAHDRAHHHRRERAQAVMADHHLEREEHAGDRGVEGARDRRGDAAAEQGLGQRRGEPQALGDRAAEGGAEMHDRALAADRGAAADRGDADEGRGEALAERHAAAAQGARLHHLGHALRLAPGQDVADQESRSRGRRGSARGPPATPAAPQRCSRPARWDRRGTRPGSRR